jgi:hypothetical protein
MSLYIDPAAEHFEISIKSLSTTPGYCFLIDIVDSTELKDGNILEWVIFIHNTFANIRGHHYIDFAPLKCLGDTMMFYIPERDLNGATPLTLFCGLWDIVSSSEECLREVRIGAAYCRQAYEITFIQGVPDIYGKDIDLTSRLLALAACREIVMNEEMACRIRSEYEASGDCRRFDGARKIAGPFPKKFKGFRESVGVYKASR